jgi:NAD(P)-dependent dehydrogenase (short-subunit alcohol dehydrogenase family)
VTGCSSGLGRHLVSAILARGDKVIATARRISDLDYMYSIDGGKERALGITLDVTEPYDKLKEKLDKAIERFGSIDILVNNAGFLISGVWEEIRYGIVAETIGCCYPCILFSMMLIWSCFNSYEETSRQMETNFFGAMKVTRCVLPRFRKARSGVILFMGSIAGWHGVGAGGPYSVSKFALEGVFLS